jgi:hypothetical protein
MINYNRNQFFILYDLLLDILDESILIKDCLHKIKGKMTHKLFRIGREYDLINNNMMITKKCIQTNRSKIIHIKKSNKQLQEELQSKGQIKIIFD